MKSRLLISTLLLTASLLAAASFALGHHPSLASAQAGTGSVSGQVVWNAPLPLPYGAATPNGEGQAEPGQAVPGISVPGPNAAPSVATEIVPAPGIPVRPVPSPYLRLIPAGAVLVAVQGTSLSARTDDQGRFRIDNVPVGQYLTVAAGPVRGVTTAVAVRPNVLVQGDGQVTDLGRLYLGQQSYGYAVPYATAPGADTATPEPDQVQPGQ